MTLYIYVKSYRFNASVTMTPIKRRKRQKFAYRIFAFSTFYVIIDIV